jgi:hypothetical protein
LWIKACPHDIIDEYHLVHDRAPPTYKTTRLSPACRKSRTDRYSTQCPSIFAKKLCEGPPKAEDSGIPPSVLLNGRQGAPTSSTSRLARETRWASGAASWRSGELLLPFARKGPWQAEKSRCLDRSVR